MIDATLYSDANRGEVMEDAALVAEARRIVEAGNRAGLTARLLGGLAVRLHAAEPVTPAFERSFADIDIAPCKADRKHLPGYFDGLGYRQ
jgi:hypothetical protein